MDILQESEISRSSIRDESGMSGVCIFSLRSVLVALSHIYLSKASSAAAEIETGRFPNAKRYGFHILDLYKVVNYIIAVDSHLFFNFTAFSFSFLTSLSMLSDHLVISALLKETAVSISDRGGRDFRQALLRAVAKQDETSAALYELMTGEK
jgi:hypothetical protein